MKSKTYRLPFLLNSAKLDPTCLRRADSASSGRVPRPFGRGVSSREPRERARPQEGGMRMDSPAPTPSRSRST